jgi:UDP-galactopyranose mutase
MHSFDSPTPDKTSQQQFDLICLSHLRWDFVYQRPQHLLSRCARDRRVFFFEEPVFDSPEPRLDVSSRECGVLIAVPHLPEGLSEQEVVAAQESLLKGLLEQYESERYVAWYYTPMALAFSMHLSPVATIYDCMDELSAFAGAPPALRELEAELFRRADVVFTGGQSLYESKSRQHRNVHAFPSSVDVPHFARAREIAEDPPDQAGIPHPRLGYAGVIDERIDRDLLAGLAAARPDWQIVMVGPVVKIDPASLPSHPNIHYLGGKAYGDLPAYMSGWDVALMPFARNESTRFISPTKTPEYLAAGRPVVSTSIRDVVRPYGEMGLVRIADEPQAFVAAAEASMAEDSTERLAKADDFLSRLSWDRTWADMAAQIDRVVDKGN